MPKAKRQELTQEELLAQALVPENEQPYEVPGNWVWVKFSYIVKEIADGPFGSNLKTEHYTNEREARIIQLSNIGEEGWRDENTRYTTFNHAQTISRSIVKPGNIVIAKMMPAGRAIVVPSQEKMYVLSSDAVKVIPSNCIKVDFFVKGINSTFFRNQVQDNTQGITRARTSIGKLKEYAFPLPPLAEQQRIVERIESLFEKLDRAKELAQNALDSFENRKTAILHKALTGELTSKWREENGVGLDSWKKSNLQSVCTMKITDGTHQTPTYCDQEIGVPFISAKDVTSGEINWTKIKYITPELHDELYKRVAPQRNDVLLAKNGTTGVAAIVDTDKIFDIYVTLAILRPDTAIIIPRYLLNVINSPICKVQFDENLTGIGVPNLHLRDIKMVEISLPTLPEQQEIVHILDNLLDKEQRARELCDVIEKIDLMKKAVLARAFRGELGTNDPTEENSLNLLWESLG